MKTYIVFYAGNSSRFSTLATEVNANSEREAVEKVYADVMASNYFPQSDGSILDCDGYEVADSDDLTIEYDGGCFYAEELED